MSVLHNTPRKKPVRVAMRAATPLTKPKWEGLQSFDLAWDESMRGRGLRPLLRAAAAQNGGDFDILSAHAGLCVRATSSMSEAHPINFGRAQLEAIEGIVSGDGVSPWEFLANYRAAFQDLYLDFTSAIGPTECEIGGGSLSLYATIVHQTDGTEPDETEILGFLPLGAEVKTADEGNRYSKSASPNAVGRCSPVGALLITPDDGRHIAKLAYDHLGVPVSEPVIATTLEQHTENESSAVLTAVLPVRFILADLQRRLDEDGEESSTPEWVTLAQGLVDFYAGAPEGAVVQTGSPGPMRELARWLREESDEGKLMCLFERIPDELQTGFLLDAMIVLIQTRATIEALYFLDSHNVTVEEADVGRQGRRRAKRSGAKIAKTVRIAPTSIRRERKPGKGGTANYSHRFERRGYTRHVTKGSHAKADLMRPCYRRDGKTGELTCPNGCRREWTPPTIVGPDHLPFVPKSRMVPGPNANN